MSTQVSELLAACRAGDDLDQDGATLLLGATGDDLRALLATADAVRREVVGDVVTYVVNRNINFTNVCVKACRFCAFSRDTRSEAAYALDLDEVARRAAEAAELGATEVCLQAGLPPEATARTYVELCAAVHEAAPTLHIHAFSPEEVKFGARRSGLTYAAFLAELKAAGLGSLPGTSAEILDDEVRRRIAPGRISTGEWLDVLRAAHGLGIPTTSTIMFGHVETRAHRAAHLLTLRALQRETGGITEFVPLSFVHTEAPLFARSLAEGVRDGPSGLDVLRMYAVARLVLGRDVPHLQASWVKEGLRMAQVLLGCGVNDLGGTLMNESISTAAGAGHGQLATPRALRRLARDAGRPPAQRTTRYELVRLFDGEDDPVEPLDLVDDADVRFGTYAALTKDPRFAWRRPSRRVG